MHRHIFSTIFSSFSALFFSSLFAVNALAIFVGNQDFSAEDVQKFLRFEQFMQAQNTAENPQPPRSDVDIIIVPNPTSPDASNPTQCSQSSTQDRSQYQQSSAQVFQDEKQAQQGFSCAQSTGQYTSQRTFCIGNEEPIMDDDTSTSSSSDTDDASSYDRPIERPMNQKAVGNIQKTERPMQTEVKEFYKYAQNKVDTNSPLANIRSNDVELNGRSHHDSRGLGNLLFNWRSSDWSNVTLTNAEIKHIRQSNSSMEQCEILGEIKHTRYRHSYISNTTFSGDFKDVKFSGSELNNVTFQGQMHQGKAWRLKRHTSFRKAKLFGVRFVGNDGDYMKLSHVNFNRTYFDDDVTFTNVDIDNGECFKGALANINGETWRINDRMRKSIKKQFPRGKINGPVTMGDIMSKVTAPK